LLDRGQLLRVVRYSNSSSDLDENCSLDLGNALFYSALRFRLEHEYVLRYLLRPACPGAHCDAPLSQPHQKERKKSSSSRLPATCTTSSPCILACPLHVTMSCKIVLLCHHSSTFCPPSFPLFLLTRAVNRFDGAIRPPLVLPLHFFLPRIGRDRDTALTISGGIQTSSLNLQTRAFCKFRPRHYFNYKWWSKTSKYYTQAL
jgi:hypothetical protein